MGSCPRHHRADDRTDGPPALRLARAAQRHRGGDPRDRARPSIPVAQRGVEAAGPAAHTCRRGVASMRRAIVTARNVKTMRDVVGTEDPAAFLDRLEQAADHTETPCGDDTMVWRSWGEGPVLLLFHGGAGSWRHWAHNIDDLSRDHRVLVPDLPGLGESAMVPEPETAEAVAEVLARGIDIILGPDATYDVAGFSFGGTAASCLAALHGPRVRSLTIIGSSGVGPSGSQVNLLKVRHLSGEERVAAHRTNLNRLMIADPAKIDAMALLIQEWNTRHSRLKT